MMPQVEKLRKNGIVRGNKTGFRCFDNLYSVKSGSYTIIYSEPTHGKSEITFEICINQAEKFGAICLICSPETGTADEIIAELIHKITGSKMHLTEPVHIDDLTFYKAMDWLNHYFIIADTDDRPYSIPQLFELADEWEKENEGLKVNLIVGEPYNELDHSEMSTKFGARQDLYIEDLMSVMRRLCRKKNRHFILTVHPSGSAIPITGKDNITYYPKPLPRQAAGGQALYRKAMTWITLWRPPLNFKDEHGQPCELNEVHVFIDKAKPKGVSIKGKCILYFDWRKNRYYEKIDGDDYYAFEHSNLVSENNYQLPISDRF